MADKAENDKVELRADRPATDSKVHLHLALAALSGLIIALIPVGVVAGVTLRGTWSTCGLPDVSAAFKSPASASCYHLAMESAYDPDLSGHIQNGTFPALVDKFVRTCEVHLNMSAAGCGHLRKVAESMASPSTFQDMCMNGPTDATAPAGRQLQADYGDDSSSSYGGGDSWSAPPPPPSGCSIHSDAKCARGVRTGVGSCAADGVETDGIGCVGSAIYAGWQCRCQIGEAWNGVTNAVGDAWNDVTSMF